MTVKPIPEGSHTVIPYLVVDGAARCIEFLKKTFDAVEIERVPGPGGKIGHAEVRIGDTVVMLGDAGEQWPATPATLYVYVADVDAAFRRALGAGGTAIREPADQFYGDRSGGVKDPVGNQWWIATHVEDVPPEELKRRMEAMAARQGNA